VKRAQGVGVFADVEASTIRILIIFDCILLLKRNIQLVAKKRRMYHYIILKRSPVSSGNT
jgi:hypothetical protein